MSKIEKLTDIIDGSLELLNQYHVQKPISLTSENDAPSLLDQCLELCEHHKKSLQESIRVIFHFGLPSNSTIPDILISIPNTEILFDCYDENNIMEKLKTGQKTGKRVLIFNNLILSKLKPYLTPNLIDQNSINSLLIINNPKDSYANLDKSIGLEFDHYCKAIYEMANDFQELPVIRYEDILESYQENIKTIFEILDLPFDIFWSFHKSPYTLSKHSNKTNASLPTSSIFYEKICEKFGYFDETDIDNFFTEDESYPKQFSKIAYKYYLNSSFKLKKTDHQFILIDSKSLPRSGIHYLKNTLEKKLGSCFSFCEWYQEVGCCRKNPCEILAYVKQNKFPHVRLCKSHDFELTDPIFPTAFSMRRVILIRDPLYILSSWYLLSQIEKYKSILEKNGIFIKKINYMHEKPILTEAYEIMDNNFIEPEEEEYAKWLNEKSIYITNFLIKWTESNKAQGKYYEVLKYDRIDDFINRLLNEIAVFNNKAIKFSSATNSASEVFSPRTDPFELPSKEMTNFVKNNKQLIIDTANLISNRIS